MNSALLTDPVVLICAGIIFVGLAAFFWAIGKWNRMSVTVEASPVDDMVVSDDPSPLPDIDLRPSEIPIRAPAPVVPAAPAVSREVAERLETMTQRLSEMQTVLMKQSAAAASNAAAGGAGAVGQGFSPETIDKLLKIIGNVVQQVDILQKSLNPTK